MAKVSRSTPAAAAPSSRRTTKTAPAVAAPSSRAKKTAPAPSSPVKPTALPATAEVIEIPASPTPSASGRKMKNAERKRASPPTPLDLDDVEMWTPRQKRRIDEECCILSADPLAADETPAVVVPAAANDDVAIVAERGKVACRDYPHPRYACAKYPFATTPHESHCGQCFCYVCDIAAPCATWKGHAKYGHCHASDKGNNWKTMRGLERRKQCKT